MEGQFASSPRKDAFKRVIIDLLRERGSATKDDILVAVRSAEPELCDDSEPCSPGCKSGHPKWRHQLDRSIYDLTSSFPPKMRADGNRPATYRLGR